MKAPFRPISFDAWRAEQIAARSDAAEVVDCPDCDGTGERECETCSHETECTTCDGHGELEWSDLNESQKARLLTRTAYAAAVIADAKAWAGWLGRDPVAELVRAGFRVWSSVTDRSLSADMHTPGGAA